MTGQSDGHGPWLRGGGVSQTAGKGIRRSTMVAHFASEADLDGWVSSEIQVRLYAEAEQVSVGGLNVQQATGLEGWFQMPGQPWWFASDSTRSALSPKPKEGRVALAIWSQESS